MALLSGARLTLRQAQGDLEQGRKVGPYEPPVTHVNLIQNWLEELKVKVPTQAK